jgi:hypothetical protein
MRWADVLFVPTKSENFGHVIREGLEAGCLVLSTLDTPWGAWLPTAGLTPRHFTDAVGFAADLEAIAHLSPRELSARQAFVKARYREWEAMQAPNVDRMEALLAVK